MTRPSLETLDLDHLDRQTFGDLNLRRELLRLFAGQCERLLPAIAGTSGPAGRREAAHALKGAARAVGAGRVAALCDRLEELGADREDDAPALGAELASAVAEVRRAIGRSGATAEPSLAKRARLA